MSGTSSGVPIIVGSIYESEDEIKESVRKFNEVNFVDFVVATYNKKSLRFVCKHKHGCPQRKRSTGIRVHQHYNAQNCKAVINFYKTAKGLLKCTVLDNVHNHPVSEALYNHEHVVLNEEEMDLCVSLRSGNCKPSQIKRVMLEKYKKNITIQKLKNMMSKIPGLDSKLDAPKFFENLELEGGNIEWELDPDGTVKCISLCSSKMKNAYKTSDPPLVQVDTTFNIESAQYKVMAVVYLNPTTDKSELAHISILSDESKPNIEFAIRSFKKICNREDLVFIVDKDFNQINVIKNEFSKAIVLLCNFHTLKWMKSIFATANC